MQYSMNLSQLLNIAAIFIVKKNYHNPKGFKLNNHNEEFKKKNMMLK